MFSSGPYIRPELVRSRVSDEALQRERLAQLVEAATALFVSKGFHGASVEEIAEAAGLSVGSIYRYVTKKEDLLLLVLDSILTEYEKALGSLVRRVRDPVERLARAIRAYYTVVARNPGKVLLAYRETRSLDKAGRDYIKQRELETNRFFEAIIQDGIEQGLFQPVDVSLAAYNIVTLGHMWGAKYWYFRTHVPLEAFIQQQIRFLLHALLWPDRWGELEDQVERVASEGGEADGVGPAGGGLTSGPSAFPLPGQEGQTRA